VCHYEKGLQVLFPLDKDWRTGTSRSYLGVPMLDGMGCVIRAYAALDDTPMKHDPRAIDVLKIFAARAAAETEAAARGSAAAGRSLCR